jgi:hypothetical protein
VLGLAFKYHNYFGIRLESYEIKAIYIYIYISTFIKSRTFTQNCENEDIYIKVSLLAYSCVYIISVVVYVIYKHLQTICEGK